MSIKSYTVLGLWVTFQTQKSNRIFSIGSRTLFKMADFSLKKVANVHTVSRVFNCGHLVAYKKSFPTLYWRHKIVPVK